MTRQILIACDHKLFFGISRAFLNEDNVDADMARRKHSWVSLMLDLPNYSCPGSHGLNFGIHLGTLRRYSSYSSPN